MPKEVNAKIVIRRLLYPVKIHCQNWRDRSKQVRPKEATADFQRWFVEELVSNKRFNGGSV